MQLHGASGFRGLFILVSDVFTGVVSFLATMRPLVLSNIMRDIVESGCDFSGDGRTCETSMNCQGVHVEGQAPLLLIFHLRRGSSKRGVRFAIFFVCQDFCGVSRDHVRLPLEEAPQARLGDRDIHMSINMMLITNIDTHSSSSGSGSSSSNSNNSSNDTDESSNANSANSNGYLRLYQPTHSSASHKYLL